MAKSKTKPYLFCPYDRTTLITFEEEGEQYQACMRCRFVHYDNPIPVVAVLIPTTHKYWKCAGLPMDGIPDNGIVLIKRNNPPFKGSFCLPCGYMKRHSHPKQQAAAESQEETGIMVRIEKLISACNPMPGRINQITHHYLARPIGGALKAGCDAKEVLVATPDAMPKICFQSHEDQIKYWYSGELGTLTGKDLDI